MGAVLLGVVEGNACSRCARAGANSPRQNKVFPSAQWASRRSAGSWMPLGQGEELLRQLPRRLELRPRR